MKTTISELMTRSGVAFGTSGARGLATAITDRVSYAYTVGFLQYLEKTRQIQGSKAHVALAGDLRPSTGRIMEAVTRAIEDKDHLPVHCGRIPSPALALFGLVEQIATIMVTGSHIPDDRNGIKFNKPTGEILKSDERGMAAQEVDLPDHLFDADGRFTRESNSMRIVNARALSNYPERYRDFFGRDALRGLRVGVYQHSAVGRDMLVES